MSKPNTVLTSIVSAFALAALFLFAAISHLEAGIPIKGVDVKLGRNPGGNAAARTTTDSSGHFSFPVQPAGSYTITVAAKQPMEITVRGAGRSITRSSPATQPNAKAVPAPLKVDLNSDGKTAIGGTLTGK
jgi:hypothetical protein